MSIEVLKPGMLSSFQDVGRRHFQHLGVPCNGAVDERAHRIANWLVGNSAHEATLEITLLGPTLRFNRNAVIAICGASLSPAIDGVPIAMHQVVSINADSVLSFGQRLAGLRAYLSVQGGFALEPVMGSTSTYVRGGYGGLRGRALKKADLIPLASASSTQPTRALPEMSLFPLGVVQGSAAPIRLIPGREFRLFTQQSIQDLVEQRYQLSAQSDRMGYRLTGPLLQLEQPLELWSEAVSAGTVQVPPDGSPIILMADSQTTGGYPRIANVAAIDLPRLAQRVPGDTLGFQWITLDEAQRLAVEQAMVFKRMEQTT